MSLLAHVGGQGGDDTALDLEIVAMVHLREAGED